MSDDPIERIRAHLKRHGVYYTQLYFSTAGVRELLRQRDELKVQVERLLAKQAQRITVEMLTPIAERINTQGKGLIDYSALPALAEALDEEERDE